MARETLFLKVAFPSPLEEPWQDSINAYFAGIDAQLFSAVVDRNMFITGGGIVSFDSGTSLLSWTEPIQLTNFVTGFFQEVPAQSLTIAPGQFVFVILSRGLEEVKGVINLDAMTETKLLDRPRGELHVDHVLMARFGDNIVFSNGAILPPDFPFPILVTSPLVLRRAFVVSEFLDHQYLNDDLIGTPDGTRDVFGICRNSDSNLLGVYLDGLRMIPGIDFDLLHPHRIRFTPVPAVGTVFVLDLYEPPIVFQGVWEESNIWAEAPLGLIDGVNDTFAICLPHELGTLRVYLDGMRMTPGTDFTVSDPTTFVFTTVPAIGSKIIVDYIIDRNRTDEFLSLFVFNEVPTKNTATEFEVVTDYETRTTQVYQDGMRMKLDVDYTEGPGDTKITFTFAPPVAATVIMDYMKKTP